MATVTGLTAERMLAIEGASVIDGEVIADHLILTKHDGTQIDAGSVIGPVGPIGPTGASGSTDPWVLSADIWTFGAADAPTYTMTTPRDVTAEIGVGQRVRLTHAAAVKYFIVTKIAFAAGTTTITLYGGTDYTLAATAITLVSFSAAKAPLGFPLNPRKWTVEVITTINVVQNNPVAGTWYNIGGSLSIPIGVWRVLYQASAVATMPSQVTGSYTVEFYATLSTTINGVTDNDLTSHWQQQYFVSSNAAQGGSNIKNEKVINLIAKTTYYLNAKFGAGYNNTLYFLGSSQPTIIRAVCAYL